MTLTPFGRMRRAEEDLDLQTVANRAHDLADRPVEILQPFA